MTWLAQDIEQHLLHPAKRLCLANVTKRNAALENRLPLFSSMAKRRTLGTHQQLVARESAAKVWQKSQASTSILDSQSAKTSEGGSECGFDAGKKVTGRKRHTLVDTLGLVLKVVVTAGNVQDRDGAKSLLSAISTEVDVTKRLKLIWADGGYRGELISWVEETFGWKLEIVEKPKDKKGFHILPKRWIVERTFAWLVRQRRLARDHERLPETSEAFIYVAMIRLMLRRLAQ